MKSFLETERLILRALTEEDADGPYPGWFNDAETCAGNSHHVFPYSRAQALDYIRALRGDKTSLVLAMVLKSSSTHVGNVSLQQIHPVHRSAELAIVIGEKSARGTGRGEEACRAIVTHGFRALNLHRIQCGTFATNAGMIATALKLGFQQEGVRRQAAYKNSGYVDVVEFGILAEEFAGMNSAK
jgi:ribosomal-protein-alanine N-acetyltransferase